MLFKCSLSRLIIFNYIWTFHLSHNLYLNLTSNLTWKILPHLGVIDFSKATKPLLFVPSSRAFDLWLSLPPESDTEVVMDEQDQDIRKEKQTKKKTLSKIFCLWVAGIAITTYGHQAVDSLSSDVHLVGQYFLKWHWQIYFVVWGINQFVGLKIRLLHSSWL